MRRVAAVVAASAMVVTVIVVAQRSSGRGPVGRPASVTTLHGTLVYAVQGPRGASHLYRWDLGAGRVDPGPTVRSLESLIDAAGAHPGWVGVTSRRPDGIEEASVLRSIGPGARATPVLDGSLVAWGAGGLSVAAVRRGPDVAGCRHRESIVVHEVTIDVREVSYRSLTCDRILTLGRDVRVTYLTRRSGARTIVDLVGYHVLHDILADHVLVSVSPTSDMIVVPARRPGAPPVEPSMSAPNGGAAVFFMGLGDPDPLPYANFRESLRLQTFLAWSTDASTALVTGRLGLREGLFELPLGPGTTRRLPVFVSSLPGPAWASYMDDGNALVETGGEVFLLRDHTMEPISMPLAAPLPGGPLVWLR